MPIIFWITLSSNVNSPLTIDTFAFSIAQPPIYDENIGIALEEVDGLLTVDGGFFSNLRDKMINSEDVTTGIHICWTSRVITSFI
jgi:hypothetical protein